MFKKNLGVHPWRLRKIVLPQHTDHAGVMWHGSCLTWLEEARVTALAEVGMPYGQMSEWGYEMPVISLEIDFIRPLLHGDEVVIESWSLPRKGVRFPWLTSFLKNGESPYLEAKIALAFVKKRGQDFHVSRHIPDEVAKAFIALQRGPINLN